MGDGQTTLPVVSAETTVARDGLTTQCSEAMSTRKSAHLCYFLMAIYFVKCYSIESQLAAVFNISELIVRKWCWFHIGNIQALKEEKVSKSVSLFAIPLKVSHVLQQIVWSTRWTPGHIVFVNGDIPHFC